MERLEFEDINDLSDLLYDIASKHDVVITAVLFYEQAQELIRHLMKHEKVEIGRADFSYADNGYHKEYYITLKPDLVLNAIPSFNGAGYNEINTDGIMFDGDASSKIAIINDGCLQFEICYKETPYDESELNEIKDVLDYIFSMIEWD